MHVAIPANLISFVEQGFATGRYGSREEVVLQTLEWLRKEGQPALAANRQGLEEAEGRSSVTAGRRP